MKLAQLHEDKAFTEFSPANVDTRYRVGLVSVDNERGLGAVPDNSSIDYRGFVALITPKKFLKLAIPDDKHSPDELADIEKKMKEGAAIGSPIFHCNLDEKTLELTIKSHEGRGRMNAVSRMNGFDSWFPVQFYVYGPWRAKNIPHEFLEGLVNGQPVNSERNEMVSLETPRIIWQGKTITP